MNALSETVPPGTPPPSPPPQPQPGPQPSGPGRMSYDFRLFVYEMQRGCLGHGSDEDRESRLTPKQRRRLGKKLAAATKRMFIAERCGMTQPWPQPMPLPPTPNPPDPCYVGRAS